jgi:hypothetical protein
MTLVRDRSKREAVSRGALLILLAFSVAASGCGSDECSEEVARDLEEKVAALEEPIVVPPTPPDATPEQRNFKIVLGTWLLGCDRMKDRCIAEVSRCSACVEATPTKCSFVCSRATALCGAATRCNDTVADWARKQ